MITEINQKERVEKMSENSKKQPKTIKVSTLIIGVIVLVSLVISFIAGTIFANKYNAQVEARAVELSSKHVGNLK